MSKQAWQTADMWGGDPRQRQDELLAQCLSILRKRNVDGYLVGGSVRDDLIGRPNGDLDLAVTSDALKVARSLANQLGGAYYALDTKRETGRVVMPDRSVIDVALIRGENIYSDLAARDFTINAMARPLNDLSTLIDPHHGAADLQTHSLRAISEQSFSTDPVRLLRAVRQAVELSFEIAPQTLQLMQRDALLLAQVSGERVRDELVKLLKRADVTTPLRALANHHLFPLVLPNAQWRAETQTRFEQIDRLLLHLSRADFSEFTTSAQTADALQTFGTILRADLDTILTADRTRALILKLTALYDKTESCIADLNHLKFGRHEIDYARKLMNQRTRFVQLPASTDALEAHRFFRDSGTAALGLLAIALSEALNQASEIRTASTIIVLLRFWSEHYDDVIAPKPLLNGAELAEQFDLRGPQIGHWLEKLIEAQVSGIIHTRTDAERFLRKTLNSEPEM